MSVIRQRDESECWTEEEVGTQFPEYFFNIEKETRQEIQNEVDEKTVNTNDVLFHLPCRMLKDWYLRAKPNRLLEFVGCDQSMFPHRRVPLPVDTLDLENYILIGMLEPQQRGQDPIQLQLDDLDFYTIDNSRGFRGYWVITPQARYWLRAPCSKRLGVPRMKIIVGGEEQMNCKDDGDANETGIHSAQLPSQEQLHYFHRMQLGLFSNMIDILLHPDGSYNSFIHDISLKQMNKILALPSVDLLLSSKFLLPHLRAIHHHVEMSRWFQGLVANDEEKLHAGYLQLTTSELWWIQLTEIAESRCQLDRTNKSNEDALHYPKGCQSVVTEDEVDDDDDNDTVLPKTPLTPLEMNSDLVALLSQSQKTCFPLAANEHDEGDNMPKDVALAFFQTSEDLKLQARGAHFEKTARLEADVHDDKGSKTHLTSVQAKCDDEHDGMPPKELFSSLEETKDRQELRSQSNKRAHPQSEIKKDLLFQAGQKEDGWTDTNSCVYKPPVPPVTPNNNPAMYHSTRDLPLPTIPKKRMLPIQNSELTLQNMSGHPLHSTEHLKSVPSIVPKADYSQPVKVNSSLKFNAKRDIIAEERQPNESRTVFEVADSSTGLQGKYKQRKLADHYLLHDHIEAEDQSRQYTLLKSHCNQPPRKAQDPRVYRRHPQLSSEAPIIPHQTSKQDDSVYLPECSTHPSQPGGGQCRQLHGLQYKGQPQWSCPRDNKKDKTLKHHLDYHQMEPKKFPLHNCAFPSPAVDIRRRYNTTVPQAGEDIQTRYRVFYPTNDRNLRYTAGNRVGGDSFNQQGLQKSTTYRERGVPRPLRSPGDLQHYRARRDHDERQTPVTRHPIDPDREPAANNSVYPEARSMIFPADGGPRK